MNEELLKGISESNNCKGIVMSFEKVFPLKGAVVTVNTMSTERAPGSTH